HTVTLEKGDNGWTSSDPTLIPDSAGDKATIPADNVKDNSEVTGVAKDPSGNESDWICPYISRHLLSLNPLLACCRRYSRGER
ncbi:TPA: hypothetical protein ACGQEZ_003292, partial [Escherichia coli]